MANTKIQIKRTSVSGRTPNTTNSSNGAYIDAGEFAVNLADKKLFSSNGSASFEVGSNLTNLSITSSITLNNEVGLSFKALSGNSVGMRQQSDDNFVFYTTNTAGGQRAVFNIYANTLSSSQSGAFRFNTPIDMSIFGIYANNSLGGSGQLLTSDGSSVYWSSPGAASINTAAQYTWTNTHTFQANVAFTGTNIYVGNSSVNTTINSTSITADQVLSTNNGNGQNYKVGDDAWIGDINTADTIGIRGQQSANNGYIVFGNADTTSKLGRTGSGALTYSVNAFTVGTSAYFVTNGNIGFGNSIPADKLSVSGNVYVSGELLANMAMLDIGNTTANVVISNNGITLYGATTITAQTIYNTTVGVTNRDLFIDDTGLMGYVSSIQAAKTNIETMTNTAWLHDLRPVSFNYRKKDVVGNYTEEAESPIEYGLIAEETELVNPSLVFYDVVDGQPQLRGVSYNKLIVPMLNEIRSLKQRIEYLESMLVK